MDPVRTAAASPETPTTTRRTFYVSAIYGLWAIITAALGLPAVIYLLVPPRSRRQSDWTDAGDISQLALNTPVEMTYRRNRVDGWKVTSEKSTVWVVKSASNKVTAYSPVCTHLGCSYHWDQPQNEFVCPCHNSLFSMDGKVLGGPAPRGLDRYQTRIEGNKLLLGQIEPGQTA
jgi:menaquinol-cytochrome c reductase iron-sulfur subunit